MTDERMQLVVKSNTIIQKARFSLTIQEQKIILFLISKITPQDDEFKLYEFKVIDFCKVCGIDHENGGNYQSLKSTIKALADKSVWVKLNSGKSTVVRWIEKPYIDEGSGTIEIKLDKDMMPYLLNLRDNFTSYELIYAIKMQSRYSIRLFELLRSHYYNKLDEYTIRFETEELKEKLDATKKTYKNFKDFRVGVLERCIQEINLYTDMDVSYEIIKEGRRVAYLLFKLKMKNTLKRFELFGELENSLNAANV